MADKYDSNGDYTTSTGDFKRRGSSERNSIKDEQDDPNQANQKADEYIRELLAEKLELDPMKHQYAIRLLDQGIILNLF